MEFICYNKRHLICIPYTVDNLHEMARILNIGSWFFHNKKNRWHYDIPKRRIKEIQSKCRVVSSKEILEIIKGAL